MGLWTIVPNQDLGRSTLHARLPMTDMLITDSSRAACVVVPRVPSLRSVVIDILVETCCFGR